MSADSENVVAEEEAFGGGAFALYRRSVLPAGGAAWARLVLLHGYGDHSGRYAHFLGWMAGQGVACHALDFRGHGRAAGRRGFVTRWAEYLDDLEEFLRLPAIGGRGPLFLLGQSHGGLILAAAGIRGLPGVAGCVLTSPYLRGRMAVPANKRLLARVADRVVPWLPVPTGVRDEWMCSDEEMLREGRGDRLALRTATPRWYLRALNAQADVLCRAPEFRLSLLVMIGDADPLADPDAARDFTERAGSADKTYLSYPGHLHELLRETHREAVFNDILRWLQERRSGQTQNRENRGALP
jgi:alpha-beta hydrolase superfamily lysophospholipase